MTRDDMKRLITGTAAASFPPPSKTLSEKEQREQRERQDAAAWKAASALAALDGMTAGPYWDALEALGLVPYESVRRIPAGCYETVVNYERPGW